MKGRKWLPNENQREKEGQNAEMIGIRYCSAQRASNSKLEPNRIELQSAQTEHPLQRNRKVASALSIFRAKAASQENGHPSRILILLGCSRLKLSDIRRSCRAADAVDRDFHRCKIRRSGSG